MYERVFSAAAVICVSVFMVCVLQALHPPPLPGFTWKRPLFGLLIQGWVFSLLRFSIQNIWHRKDGDSLHISPLNTGEKKGK